LVDQHERLVSAAVAVSRAGWFVNGPVMVLMFGFPALVFGIATLLGAPAAILGWAVGISAIVGWCGAWAAWSFMTPIWRLWAYRRVDDLEELKSLAVAAKVIWPEGHHLQRTEIMSAATRAELARLEALAAQRRATT
jgi:hypothetical protein